MKWSLLNSPPLEAWMAGLGMCRQYTSHVTLSVHSARAAKCVAQHIGSSVCTSAFSLHPHGHPCCALECPFFDSLFLTLFLSVCFSYLLLPEP